MASKVAIEERRRQVWDMMLKGIPETVMAQALGVHRNTIVNDVREIRKINRKHVSDLDVYGEIGDTVAKLDEIFKEALSEYSQAKKASEKNQYLDKAMSAIVSKTKILMDVGILPKASHEITGKLVVEGVDVKEASVDELKSIRSTLLERLSRVGSN